MPAIRQATWPVLWDATSRVKNLYVNALGRPNLLEPRRTSRGVSEDPPDVLQLLTVLFVISVMAFALVRMIPGDPATVQLGSEATPAALAALRQDLGLDRPTGSSAFSGSGT